MKGEKKVCPKCGEKKRMTSHHVYPRHVFGVAGNKYIEELCRKCHDELERLIRLMEKRILQLHPEVYKKLFDEFVSQ